MCLSWMTHYNILMTSICQKLQASIEDVRKSYVSENLSNETKSFLNVLLYSYIDKISGKH